MIIILILDWKFPSKSDSAMFNFKCVLHGNKSYNDLIYSPSPSDLKKQNKTTYFMKNVGVRDITLLEISVQ